MKLFTYYRSSASYRVRIGLNVKGLAYESIPIHLRKGEHRAEVYRDVNAQGLVPALIDDTQRAIPQSLAILEYLDEKYPTPPLLPVSIEDRAQVRSLALAIACDIHPLNNLRVLQYLRHTLQQNEESVTAWYRHWIAEGFDAIEQSAARYSGQGRYCYGDHLSLADACLIPQWYNARLFGCDLARYPTLASICAHLESQPAFIAARPEAQPDAE